MAIPTVASKLIPYAVTFRDVLTANPGNYFLEAGDLVPLTAATAALITAQEAVANPGSRSSSLIFARNAAQESYYEVARPMYAAIQVNPEITDEHKSDAGVRVKESPSPVPVPSEEPEIDILSVTGRTVKARLHGTTIEHRSKPAGCKGAQVWTFTGEEPPEELSAWIYWGQTTKTNFMIEFPTSVEPGTKVWIAAGWFNAKGQVGPVCDPVSTYTQFGGVTLDVASAKKKAA